MKICQTKLYFCKLSTLSFHPLSSLKDFSYIFIFIIMAGQDDDDDGLLLDFHPSSRKLSFVDEANAFYINSRNVCIFITL